MSNTSVRKRSIRRWRRTMPAACSRPLSVNASDLSSSRVTYPSDSSRPIISCTVGADTCMARAMLAPVIGSLASESQYMIWRYSSSATVASDIRKDANPSHGPPPLASHQAPAGALRQGAARGRGLALRAQVGRLQDDRLSGRGRHQAPEPGWQTDEPLLP